MPDAPHTAPDGGEDVTWTTLDSADHGSEVHHAPLLSRIRSRRFVLTSGAAALVVIVLLALLLTMSPPLQGSKAGTTPTGTTIAQETSGLTTTASPTNTTARATAVGTRTPTATTGTGGNGTGGGTGGTGGAGGAPAPTSTSQHMRVTNLALAVDRTSFDGPCTEGVPFTFTLTVTVGPHAQGGNVSYQWLSGDGAAAQDVRSLAFGPGVVTKTVTYSMLVPWQFGDGSQRWVAAQATAPNTLTSAHQTYSLTCLLMVTDITGSPTPASWTGACASSQQFGFSYNATVSYGPGDSLTWSINSSNGFTSMAWHPPSGTIPLLLSSDGSLHITYRTVSLGFGVYSLLATAPNGDYWFQLTLTSPNNSVSKTLHVTKNCQ